MSNRESAVLCGFCGHASRDEGAICEMCFDRGLHWLDDDAQADASAALRAVGTVVEISTTARYVGNVGAPTETLRGVVVGCRAGAADGEDVWTVKAEDGGWYDVICSWAHVLECNDLAT